MKIALAGDTMLGRNVAERLAVVAPSELFSDELVAVAHESDLFILNLECAISARGERWPDPAKPFFFRAPPAAADALRHLGVSCVSLANNHALDFGADALLDTFAHLADAGIAWVGAGVDETAARVPAVLEAAGLRVGVVAVTDHPAAYAAAAGRPGVAFADLRHGTPTWLIDSIRRLDTDVILVTPHWGPNMVVEPRPARPRGRDRVPGGRRHPGRRALRPRLPRRRRLDRVRPWRLHRRLRHRPLAPQ